jgi:hypothetical protein
VSALPPKLRPKLRFEMSEFVYLYRCYKQKETRAFNLLFGHSDWKMWSFRKLVELAEREVLSLGPKQGTFASLLKHATVCREKVFEAFQHAPDIRKAQHRYVVFCYRRLLSSVSKTLPRNTESKQDLDCENLDDRVDEGIESPSPDDADHVPPGESGEHLQDYLFFDIIEKYIDTILHFWRLAREDILSVSTATTGMLSVSPRPLVAHMPAVSNCIYKDMRSFLHAEDLLAKVEDVTSLPHPLLSRLRPAACTLVALPKAREFNDGDASYIRRYACSYQTFIGANRSRQLSWCLDTKRAWSPPICSQLVEDTRDQSGSAVLSAVVSIYLLSELQWAKESRLLQAAAEMRISYLESLVLQKSHILVQSPKWLQFAHSVKDRISSCHYPWVLGNIITWAEANMLNIFDTILSEPLIPTYAHVYQHLRNTATIEADDDIELFCKRSHLLLFWDRRRPRDEKSLETSFRRWIATVTPTATSRIVNSRFEENLAFCIGSNDWCISQVTAKKHMLSKVDYLDADFVSSLQTKLEANRCCVDTFALSVSIRSALEELDSAAAAGSHELLWNMRNSPEAVTLFPLHFERLSSCMQKTCMYCRKAVAQAHFVCSTCAYATYCGRSCQKANWPLHKQYCSSSRLSEFG